MGYLLNNEGYSYFIRIEVGMREFLIQLIKKKGIRSWVTSFLGKVQRENLQEINKRITEAQKKQENPDIQDTFIYKLNRAKKDSELSFQASQLFHPFYYLNWTDMENLIQMKANSDLIDEAIGKLNREVVAKHLLSLNFLRNDVAHSRFISEGDLKIIKSSFEQISTLIPDFPALVANQSKEGKLQNLLDHLLKWLELIQTKELLDQNEINELLSYIDVCTNSFWLNSTRSDFVVLLEKLSDQLKVYEKHRQTPGGLLPIYNWKKINSKLTFDIINEIKNGKI